jgi:hypothetical protein
VCVCVCLRVRVSAHSDWDRERERKAKQEMWRTQSCSSHCLSWERHSDTSDTIGLLDITYTQILNRLTQWTQSSDMFHECLGTLSTQFVSSHLFVWLIISSDFWFKQEIHTDSAPFSSKAPVVQVNVCLKIVFCFMAVHQTVLPLITLYESILSTSLLIFLLFLLLLWVKYIATGSWGGNQTGYVAIMRLTPYTVSYQCALPKYFIFFIFQTICLGMFICI